MNLLAKTGLALAAFASLGVAALPVSAQTGSISIFDTGVDSTGASLPNGTQGDAHYTLVTNPVGTSSQLEVVTSASPDYSNLPWLGDSPTSAWIAPANSPFVGNKNGGFYDYQTTFDLTNFNPATASIAGDWATDNYGTDILVNGISTGNTSNSALNYTAFSINSGFHSGVNTLDFLVLDDGTGATGLRVGNINGSAAPVPEASTTVSLGLLMSLGLGGMIVARRKSAKA